MMAIYSVAGARLHLITHCIYQLTKNRIFESSEITVSLKSSPNVITAARLVSNFSIPATACHCHCNTIVI